MGVSMLQRTARLPASWAGASSAASTAAQLMNPRVHWMLALASLLALPILASRPLLQVHAALMTRRRSQTPPRLARQVLIADLEPTTFSLVHSTTTSSTLASLAS